MIDAVTQSENSFSTVIKTNVDANSSKKIKIK